MTDYIDATVAAADNYKLLGQEGNVRVVEMILAPGQKDNVHSHHSETVYFITGSKVKIYVGDEVMEADIPDGHVMFHGAWTHQVENVGDKTLKAIIFEQMP